MTNVDPIVKLGRLILNVRQALAAREWDKLDVLLLTFDPTESANDELIDAHRLLRCVMLGIGCRCGGSCYGIIMFRIRCHQQCSTMTIELQRQIDTCKGSDFAGLRSAVHAALPVEQLIAKGARLDSPSADSFAKCLNASARVAAD